MVKHNKSSSIRHVLDIILQDTLTISVPKVIYDLDSDHFPVLLTLVRLQHASRFRLRRLSCVFAEWRWETGIWTDGRYPARVTQGHPGCDYLETASLSFTTSVQDSIRTGRLALSSVVDEAMVDSLQEVLHNSTSFSSYLLLGMLFRRHL